MRISFDPEADALYFELRPAKVAQTKEVGEGIYLDLDDQGELRGIEILYASARAPEVAKGHLEFGLAEHERVWKRQRPSAGGGERSPGHTAPYRSELR